MMLWSPPRRPVGSARPYGLLARRRTRCVATGRPAGRRRRTGGPYLPGPRRPAPRAHGTPRPSSPAVQADEHEALAAAATIATPALWVAAVSQAPAGSTRALVLAVGWVGIASLLGWRRPDRQRR